MESGCFFKCGASELKGRLCGFKRYGFCNAQVVGICLAFPFVFDGQKGDEEGEGVAAEEVHVESVGGGVEAAKREDAGGEEGEGKEGREEAEGHGFLEELPGDGKVIVEADVGPLIC